MRRYVLHVCPFIMAIPWYLWRRNALRNIWSGGSLRLKLSTGRRNWRLLATNYLKRSLTHSTSVSRPWMLSTRKSSRWRRTWTMQNCSERPRASTDIRKRSYSLLRDNMISAMLWSLWNSRLEIRKRKKRCPRVMLTGNYSRWNSLTTQAVFSIASTLWGRSF